MVDVQQETRNIKYPSTIDRLNRHTFHLQSYLGEERTKLKIRYFQWEKTEIQKKTINTKVCWFFFEILTFLVANSPMFRTLFYGYLTVYELTSQNRIVWLDHQRTTKDFPALNHDEWHYLDDNNEVHRQLDKYNVQNGLQWIVHLVKAVDDGTIHLLMPVPMPSKCDCHHKSTCTNAKYSDACETIEIKLGY